MHSFHVHSLIIEKKGFFTKYWPFEMTLVRFSVENDGFCSWLLRSIVHADAMLVTNFWPVSHWYTRTTCESETKLPRADMTWDVTCRPTTEQMSWDEMSDVLLIVMWTADIIERVKNVETPLFRPTVPAYSQVLFNPSYYTLMEQCWSEEPTARPNFKVICDVVKSFTARRWHSQLVVIVAT